jgi:hypothetical protein
VHARCKLIDFMRHRGSENAAELADVAFRMPFAFKLAYTGAKHWEARRIGDRAMRASGRRSRRAARRFPSPGGDRLKPRA